MTDTCHHEDARIRVIDIRHNDCDLAPRYICGLCAIQSLADEATGEVALTIVVSPVNVAAVTR